MLPSHHQLKLRSGFLKSCFPSFVFAKAEGSRTRDHDHVLNHVIEHVIDRVIDHIIVLMKYPAPLVDSFYTYPMYLCHLSQQCCFIDAIESTKILRLYSVPTT